MMQTRQLPLGLGHEAEYGRESFIVGPANRDALTLVERWPDWPQPVLFLSGPPGSGKTHLAHIWAAVSNARFLPPQKLGTTDAAASLGNVGCVVEDLDRISLAESGLFHLLNAARETKLPVLLTSRQPAGELAVHLADLRSRLRLATPAALLPPDDELLRLVLVKLFSDRQLVVDKSVIDFVLARMERSYASAVHLVDALDREALAASAAVTRQVAARVLAALDERQRFTDSE